MPGLRVTAATVAIAAIVLGTLCWRAPAMVRQAMVSGTIAV
jgi:hypothetical protein